MTFISSELQDKQLSADSKRQMIDKKRKIKGEDSRKEHVPLFRSKWSLHMQWLINECRNVVELVREESSPHIGPPGALGFVFLPIFTQYVNSGSASHHQKIFSLVTK